MARGPSGRLVVDFDPALKREFHAALAADGTNFKEWILARVAEYLEHRQQMRLPGISYLSDSPPVIGLAAEDPATYRTDRTPS